MHRVKRANPHRSATFDDLTFRNRKIEENSDFPSFVIRKYVPMKMSSYGKYFIKKYRIGTRPRNYDWPVFLNCHGFPGLLKKGSLVNHSEPAEGPGCTRVDNGAGQRSVHGR